VPVIARRHVISSAIIFTRPNLEKMRISFFSVPRAKTSFFVVSIPFVFFSSSRPTSLSVHLSIVLRSRKKISTSTRPRFSLPLSLQGTCSTCTGNSWPRRDGRYR
jgi:hypothetical protein